MSLVRLPAAALCAFALSMIGASAHAATPAIGAGQSMSAGLGADGALRTWGDDSAGALGLGRSLTTGLRRR